MNGNNPQTPHDIAMAEAKYGQRTTDKSVPPQAASKPPTDPTKVLADFMDKRNDGPKDEFDIQLDEAEARFRKEAEAEQAEPTYTLAEARKMIARNECGAYGHNWDIITQAGTPVSIICSRCDEAGNVVMK